MLLSDTRRRWLLRMGPGLVWLRVRRVLSDRDIGVLAERGVAFAGAAGLAIALGLAGGGYLPRPWRLSTFALLALAAAALIGRRRVAVPRLGWWFLAALTGFLAWTAASAWWWSDDRATSILEAERIVVYVAAVVAVLLALERASLPYLLFGLVGGVTFVSTYGLAKYLIGPSVLNAFQGRLLFEPLGYANGFGIYAGIAIVVVVGLVLAYPRRLVVVVAAPIVAILTLVLYYTESRAAWIAIAAGVATILRFGRRTSPAVWIVLATATVAVAAAIAIASPDTGIAAHVVGENRPHYWHVAWKQYELHATLGSGPGTFANYWLHYRTIPSFARDAHSLYLETLAETGPVGLGLLLMALALPLLALRGNRDPLAATAAGGYVTYVLHTGVDWDWELPAVTVLGLICGSALLVAGRSRSGEIRLRTRLVLLAPVIGFGVAALIRLKTGPALPFGP